MKPTAISAVPKVAVTRYARRPRRDLHAQVFRVAACPHCGEAHMHLADGLRIASCGAGAYHLVDVAVTQ